MNQNWHVYIVRCADDTLYTGITTDIDRRIEEHNSSERGARYTRSRRPVTLAWTEAAPNHSVASKREHQIRNLSRPDKMALVKGTWHCPSPD